jgi:hypothetical protein
MTVADFEEKTYEVAYDIELSAGAGLTPWAPGQVLEHLVGFDAAASPDASHVLWRVLGAPRPDGLVLLPEHWTGAPGRRPARKRLPSNPVSFMVQFKRPEIIRSHAGKQWRLWRKPYFRFKLDPTQQRTLKRLEKNTVGDAIVRYAAPAFVTDQEMDIARLSGQVISSSGHVTLDHVRALGVDLLGGGFGGHGQSNWSRESLRPAIRPVQRPGRLRRVSASRNRIRRRDIRRDKWTRRNARECCARSSTRG